MAPIWKKLMKHVDLDEPTSFLDHFFFGMYSTWMQTEGNHYWATQRNVWITYFFWSNWKNCQSGKNLTQRRLRGLTTRKDMLKNALRNTANWQTKKDGATVQSFQVLAWMIINSKRRSLNQLENDQKYAHWLSRIGRPNILWSVHALARSVTKWTQVCD